MIEAATLVLLSLVAVEEDDLDEARREFASSEFARCEARLVGVERSLSRAIAGANDFETLKRVNLWLGLCEAALGEEEAAKRAFLRASRLPGPEPDPTIFPPAILALYTTTRVAEVETCALRMPSEHRLEAIDGRASVAGMELPLGEHYVAWSGGSKRVALAGDCRVELDVVPLIPPPKLPAAAEPEVEPDRWWLWMIAGAAIAAAIIVPISVIEGADEPRYTIAF